MKKKLIITFTLIICLIGTFFQNDINIKAAGTANLGFSGNSTVIVGDNITITMYVSNVANTNNGVVSVGGNLSFDSTYLQYVSGTGAKDPYTFQINTSANYKIAGLDTTLDNGIKGSEAINVFTFVFKALKEGTTTITLANHKLTDTSSGTVATVVNSKTITISSEQPKSNDANLTNLGISGYNLTPTFSSNNTNYTLTVPYNVSSITVNATKSNGKANVSGIGTKTLNVGSNTITVQVTAEDGTVKNYTIVVTKEEEPKPTLDNDATLKSLDVSGYTLSPTFKSDITNYTMKVGKDITELTIDAVPNSSKAQVSISGNSGWNKEKNNVTIKVTAEDGSIKNYIITVEKEIDDVPVVNTKSTDNYLTSIEIKGVDLSFNKSKNSYNIEVPYEIDKLDIKTITSDLKAKVKVLGNTNLLAGKVNVVDIEVTAEDGSIRIYTLNVTRSNVESKNKLNDLDINGYPLKPKFNSDVEEYNITVPNNVDSLDISAIANNKNAKIEITGNDNFKEGNNVVLVKVTDENGFKRIYQINVLKEAKANILGMDPWIFWSLLGLIGVLSATLVTLIVRRRKIINNVMPASQTPVTPIIEFKPEFNFGSKNQSDDDVVYGGNLNQKSPTAMSLPSEKPKLIGDVSEIKEAKIEEIPYDIYDDIVTKDELIDSLNEALETDNADKLKFLLGQEKLNRMKEQIKKNEQNGNSTRPEGNKEDDEYFHF